MIFYSLWWRDIDFHFSNKFWLAIPKAWSSKHDFSFYSGLQEMNKTVMPLMDKCSDTHKEVYKGMMGWIHAKTEGLCDSPDMNFTRPTTCQADTAMLCFQYIMSHVGSQSVPKDRLCRYGVFYCIIHFVTLQVWRLLLYHTFCNSAGMASFIVSYSL